jgi:hypothetical protein
MIYTAPKSDRGRRQATFDAMATHALLRPGLIVETGTAGNPSDHIGAGNSTELWNELAGDVTLIEALSIDIDPAAVRVAQYLYKNVQFICGDAAEVLRHMPGEMVNRITLLYLDSMWDPTGVQAMRELLAIWHRLQPGTMIAIDDRHSDEIGKHVATQHFMASLGIEQVFCDYQIGWLKP